MKILIFIAIASVLIVILTACSKKSSESKNKKTEDKDDSYEKLCWLRDDKSPFNIPVLDCRSVTTTMLSFTEDKAVAERYVELTKSDGKEYEGKKPEPSESTKADLEYNFDAEEPEDGPAYISGSMEEKWNIYKYGKTMYFVRSWSGDLVYAADTEFNDNKLFIRKILFKGNMDINATQAIRDVDFIVKSHLYRILSVAPIPQNIGDSPKEMALYLFSQFGNWAWFGSKEDTLNTEVINHGIVKIPENQEQATTNTKKEESEESPGIELRKMVMKTSPEELGFKADADYPTVYGVLTEWDMDGVKISVMSMRDGTASLYTTSTFGVIGGQGHGSVRKVAEKYVKLGEKLVESSKSVTEYPYPEKGKVNYYLLTYDGIKLITGDEAVIEKGSDPTSSLYAAAQDVLTELRLTTENKKK